VRSVFRNLSRAGVERVFDQLLHGARRTLHHLAGGDAVDDGLGELADGHRFLPSPLPACGERSTSQRSEDVG
jgi:hypothetical protein